MAISSLEYLSGPFKNRHGETVITVIDEDVIREIPWNDNQEAKLFMIEPITQKMVRSLPDEQMQQEAKESLKHYLIDLILDVTETTFTLKIWLVEVLAQAFLHGFYEAYYE